jgi:predicted metal-dependent hydrolase
MRGDADRDRLEPGGHFRRYPLRSSQHHRQRPWPESVRERACGLWELGHERRDIVHRGDVDDQRIVRWPLLRGEDALDGAWIERVRAEPVDGFRWKRHQSARTEAVCSARNRLRIRIFGIDSKDFRHGWVILPSMQLALPFGSQDSSAPIAPLAPIAPTASIYFIRHKRARRYVLRVEHDGRLRVTIPRGGSRREAEAFVQRNTEWIAKQWDRAPVPLRETHNDRALQEQARNDLPKRLLELAARHGLEVTRVTVRNQRSRWGSCGRDGHICLNWRLVLMPAFVRDYVLIHELMHLRRMDHSPAYWRLVADAFPDYLSARDWLRRHGPALR